MKQKNSELPSRWLLAIFGVIMTAAIIFMGISYYYDMEKPMKKIAKGTKETVEEFQDHKITMYEDEELQGSQLINYIKDNLGDYLDTETAPFYVRVKTKFAGITYTNDYVNKKFIKDIRNVSAIEKFIKPTAKFDCEVIRSENKVVLGVLYTQK